MVSRDRKCTTAGGEARLNLTPKLKFLSIRPCTKFNLKSNFEICTIYCMKGLVKMLVMYRLVPG